VCHKITLFDAKLRGGFGKPGIIPFGLDLDLLAHKRCRADACVGRPQPTVGWRRAGCQHAAFSSMPGRRPRGAL